MYFSAWLNTAGPAGPLDELDELDELEEELDDELLDELELLGATQ